MRDIGRRQIGGIMQTSYHPPFVLINSAAALAPQAGGFGFVNLDFDVSTAWPVSHEFRSASLSVNIYIAY